MRKLQYHIFVDTNVLVNCFIGTAADVACMHYLYALQGKRLYVSALSIAQLIALLQKRHDKEEIRKYVLQVLHHCVVVSCTDNDIKSALEIEGGDMEDNIQYCISQKVKCPVFITNNLKDYRHYDNIASVIRPSEVRTIKR